MQQTSADARALPSLLRNAFLPVLIALALAVGMGLLNRDVLALASEWGWKPITSGAYVVLLEAVAGVSGVFLALYFTAVSTVAASVYVNVPHDIRALIFRDRLGNMYVTGVSFTIALSVVLLITQALTDSSYELGPPIIGLFAAFSIFAFIRLGQRAFYLADPTLLAHTLARDFNSWFTRATDKGWRWEDRSFQELYRRQAHKSVVSLSSLLAIASDQPHLRGGSVRQLTSQVVGLLEAYLRLRDEVPTKSRWFGDRYEHKQWYLTDNTELDMASATATALQPRAIPDLAWVEAALLGPLVDLVDDDLAHQDYEDVYVVLAQLARAWTQAGERWAAADLASWTDRITTRTSARLAAPGEPRIASRPALLPAIWDAIAMLPLSAELGFHRNVTARPVASLSKALQSTDWSNRHAPYSIGVPRPVIGVLEELRAGRAFEAAIVAPASTRTPTWYVRELALYTYERAFYEEVRALVKFLAAWYPATARQLAEAKLPDAVGAVLSRGIEVGWKLEHHVSSWERIASDLRAGPLLVDLVRPTRDWDAVRTEIAGLRGELLRQLATSIPEQAVRERDADIPDYLGEAVHRVGEASFEALVDNNDALFAELFTTYFIGVMSIVNRIQQQVADWQPSAAATAIAEPVIDALDLSGFALIFSELHGNVSLWQTCVTPWRSYFGATEGPRRLQIVAAMHHHQRNVFGITHRALGRTRWQMSLNAMLGQLPRDAPSRPFATGAVQHESALIRRIAPHDGLFGSMFHASDVFVVRFLRTIDGAHALDFGVADGVADAIADRDDDEGRRDEDEGGP